jgi:hypothetical protein
MKTKVKVTVLCILVCMFVLLNLNVAFDLVFIPPDVRCCCLGYTSWECHDEDATYGKEYCSASLCIDDYYDGWCRSQDALCNGEYIPCEHMGCIAF